MSKIIFGALTLLALTFVLGCTYKNAEDVYPANNSGCDTTNVSYSGYILPFVTANCYSCHSQANSGLGDGYVLEPYFNLKVYAENGFIVRDINITDLSSINHMPHGLPSLSSCDILKITAWINQGAKNN